jgi:hypothetical protein
MKRNMDLLREMRTGEEVPLMANASTVQGNRVGLMAVAILLLAVGLYLALAQLVILPGAEKGYFTLGGAAFAFAFSFFMYKKCQDYKSIDPNLPLLGINRQVLAFPQLQISIPWRDIGSIEVIDTSRKPKQATQTERDVEVRVVLRIERPKGVLGYGEVSKAALDLEKRGYISIDHTALDVNPHYLVEAIDRYREGL